MAKEKYLHDAIKTIVNSYGKNLYYDKRMINYISDYYSFDPLALYNVMKTLIADGYAGRLIDASQNSDWKIYVTQSIAKVQKNYGFAPVYVNYCFQCLAYGIGLYPTINKRLLDEVEGRTPPPQPSVPASQTSTRNQGQSVKQSTTQQKPTTTPRKRSTGANRQPPQNPIPPRNQGNSFPPFRPSPSSPTPQPQGSSQKQQVSLSNGCGCSGCFDSLTNTYVIIIIILWVIAQCSN